MTVSLTPTLENMIQELIDSGMYSNASEVVREALRGFFQNAIQKTYSELEKEAVLKGYEQAKKGIYSTRTVDQIYQAVVQKYASKTD